RLRRSRCSLRPSSFPFESPEWTSDASSSCEVDKRARDPDQGLDQSLSNGESGSHRLARPRPAHPRRRTRRDSRAFGMRQDDVLEHPWRNRPPDRRPDEMSGGEQQRIAIAVALSNKPPLLLADEPTGELDTKTGQEVLNLFQSLNRDLKKTIVVVTHDARVAAIANRVLDIRDGKIV